MAERKFFILNKVAEIFDKSIKEMLSWAETGDLPVHKDNFGIHCTREDIEQLVDDFPNLKDYWIRYTRNEIWPLPFDTEQTVFKISDFNTDWIHCIDEIREKRQENKERGPKRIKIAIEFTVTPDPIHSSEDFVKRITSDIRNSLRPYGPEDFSSSTQEVE